MRRRLTTSTYPANRMGRPKTMPRRYAVRAVQMLALRPELRDSFPVSDAIDMYVRWNA